MTVVCFCIVFAQVSKFHVTDLLAAFNDTDLDNPTEIDFKAKERISRTSGKSIDDVSKLLVNYKQSLIVQQWLVLK